MTLIISAVCMELVYSEAQESGFCEGELLKISANEKSLGAEVFGERFLLDFSAAERLLAAANQLILPFLMPFRPLIWAANSFFVQIV